MVATPPSAADIAHARTTLPRLPIPPTPWHCAITMVYQKDQCNGGGDRMESKEKLAEMSKGHVQGVPGRQAARDFATGCWGTQKNGRRWVGRGGARLVGGVERRRGWAGQKAPRASARQRAALGHVSLRPAADSAAAATGLAAWAAPRSGRLGSRPAAGSSELGGSPVPSCRCCAMAAQNLGGAQFSILSMRSKPAPEE